MHYRNTAAHFHGLLNEFRIAGLSVLSAEEYHIHSPFTPYTQDNGTHRGLCYVSKDNDSRYGQQRRVNKISRHHACSGVLQGVRKLGNTAALLQSQTRLQSSAGAFH